MLLAALTGIVLGSGAGFLAGRESRVPITTEVPALASAPTPAVPPQPPLVVHSFPRISFAQQGEDLIMDQIVDELAIRRPTYLDIGAHEPILNNNTFLFYMLGSRGVLVEPNPVMVAKLREQRPGDTVLAVGVGVTNDAAADYFVTRGDGQLNTFSKQEADELRRTHGADVIERVIRIPLVNVNQVLAEHFPPGGADVLSVDTEGLDLDILRSLDFSRFRPKIICAETLGGGTKLVSDEMIKFLVAKNYTVRGGTFVNTIFVANELLQRPPNPTQPVSPPSRPMPGSSSAAR